KITGADVSFEVVLTTPACPLKGQIEHDCRLALGAVAGIGQVAIRWGANVAALRGATDRSGIPGVKNIVAVGSG
ncbi:MAG TPA: iron-sulfur cluster assembly protein, partial [Candidatus Acidoferrum sp.]|nr:iron-sulfur cluster assembly protein [Candidatus Acidoferrum sp.]